MNPRKKLGPESTVFLQGMRYLGCLVFLLFFVGFSESIENASPVPGSEPVSVPPQNVSDVPSSTGGQNSSQVQRKPEPPYSYNSEGRRDPFSSILLVGKKQGRDLLPPLQRVELSQLKLIGIVWGKFGYNAMLQATDGKGYTVRPGTLVGANGGSVKKINKNELVVEETFTDIFGEKKNRRFVFQLHPQEDME